MDRTAVRPCADAPAAARTFTVTVDPDVERFLGAAAVGRCLRNLWPVACPTCGGALAGDATLVVHRVPGQCAAEAGLHHPGCRASGVHARLPDHAAAGPRSLSLPVSPGPPAHPAPVVLVNPTCDRLVLRRCAGAGWRIGTLDAYRELGFGPDGDGRVAATATVPGCGDRLDVRFTGRFAGPRRMTVPTGATVAAAAARAGCVEVWVGTKFFPPAVSRAGARSVVADPEVLGGRVPVLA